MIKKLYVFKMSFTGSFFKFLSIENGNTN